MKYFYLLLISQLSLFSFGQDGTVGDPFTSLDHAAVVSVAGIYYFNINGTNFNTYVDANGYVQIAIDFGNGSGNLPQGTSLTNSTRGILSVAVLALLTETQEVRISSSTGNFDVTTTNATIISRVQSNTTLHQGTADNGINDGWTGTNSIFMTINASCPAALFSMHESIVHICGNTNGTHWISQGGNQMEKHANGDIADASFLQLWVAGNLTLPIELMNFNVTPLNSNAVAVNWQTASELNNDFFTIQRSENGSDWEDVQKINGAGSSTNALNYRETDYSPFSETSYYRLKQTDFDGHFAYSKTMSVDMGELAENQTTVYPNPSKDKIWIDGEYNPQAEYVVKSAHGVTVQQGQMNESIDISSLPSGVYFLQVIGGDGLNILFMKK